MKMMKEVLDSKREGDERGIASFVTWHAGD
jgi:hypothetical protein